MLRLQIFNINWLKLEILTHHSFSMGALELLLGQATPGMFEFATKWKKNRKEDKFITFPAK
jgi:hypothetical protein